MGQTTSIYIPPEDPQTVRFDLRNVGIGGGYEFQMAEGKFDIPAGLGVRVLEMEDPVRLAQSEGVQTIAVPVGVEKRHRIKTTIGLDSPEVISQLIGGGGIVIAERKQDGDWVPAGLIDSDLGVLLVSGKASPDLRIVLRVETREGRWYNFWQAGCFLVARAEGFVHCSVKARFETDADRQLVKAKSALKWIAAAAAFGLLLLLSQRRRRFRPRLD